MIELDNALRRQAFSIPELLRAQYADLEPKARTVLTTPEIFSIQKIVLTGCGDSYAASLAVRYAFETLTGLPTEVVPAIELSRFYSPKQLGFAPHNPLIITVSNSGKVARVCEALERGVSKGAFVLGVTGKPDSPLGQQASRVMKLDIPSFENAPGTRSYLVSVLSLLLLAIRIGEVRGRYTMDQAGDYRRAICDLADDLERALPAMDAAALETAREWAGMEAFDFIGAGPDYATTRFGQAKTFEAIGKYAMPADTEEWLHLNFFMRPIDKIGTVVFHSHGNPALSRTCELLTYTQELKRPVLVITDAPEELPNGYAHCVTVPKPKYPMLASLVQFVPVCLLMGYLTELIGEEYCRGCKDSWEFCSDGKSIYSSKIEIL